MVSWVQHHFRVLLRHFDADVLVLLSVCSRSFRTAITTGHEAGVKWRSLLSQQVGATAEALAVCGIGLTAEAAAREYGRIMSAHRCDLCVNSLWLQRTRQHRSYRRIGAAGIAAPDAGEGDAHRMVTSPAGRCPCLARRVKLRLRIGGFSRHRVQEPFDVATFFGGARSVGIAVRALRRIKPMARCCAARRLHTTTALAPPDSIPRRPPLTSDVCELV